MLSLLKATAISMSEKILIDVAIESLQQYKEQKLLKKPLTQLTVLLMKWEDKNESSIENQRELKKMLGEGLKD